MKNSTTKHRYTSRTSGFLSALTGMALLAAAGSPASAGKGNVGNSNIMPPQSRPYGLSYAEWAERFWQWAHSFPATANPASGTAPPESAQSGPVWFLASAPFSPVPGAATARSITIPAGTSLFAPASSFFNNNAALPENTTFTEEELLEQANDIWDALAVLTECFIDGVPVKGLEDPQETAYRVETGLFPVTVADHDNLFAGDGVPDGGILDEVAVGAFVMIKPLTVGQHTVRLVGAIEPAPGFVLTKDVTYTVTVTP
jgi:hypothetical protein